MGKYDNFSNPRIKEDNFEKVFGNYGCQTCNEFSNEAHFNKHEGILFWVCKQNHRSEIKVGV